MNKPAAPSGEELTETISLFSEEVLPKRVRHRIFELSDELDQLLFLDQTGELAADRNTLIKIASNPELIPPQMHDIVILETAKHLGRRVKAVGDGRRITWREGEKYGLPIHSLTKADLQAIGFTENMSKANLGELLKTQFPDIPEFWMNDNSAQLAEMALRNFMVNRTVWDCLVANLGFWAALTIVGSIVIFLAFVAEIGWQAALALAIIYSGVATIYFLLQCAVNPEYQA